MAGKFVSLDTASPGIAFVITSSPVLAQNPAVPLALYNWDELGYEDPHVYRKGRRVGKRYSSSRKGKPAQAITVLQALATSKSLDAVCVGKSWDILNWLPQAVTTARIE